MRSKCSWRQEQGRLFVLNIGSISPASDRAFDWKKAFSRVVRRYILYLRKIKAFSEAHFVYMWFGAVLHINSSSWLLPFFQCLWSIEEGVVQDALSLLASMVGQICTEGTSLRFRSSMQLPFATWNSMVITLIFLEIVRGLYCIYIEILTSSYYCIA